MWSQIRRSIWTTWKGKMLHKKKRGAWIRLYFTFYQHNLSINWDHNCWTLPPGARKYIILNNKDLVLIQGSLIEEMRFSLWNGINECTLGQIYSLLWKKTLTCLHESKRLKQPIKERVGGELFITFDVSHCWKSRVDFSEKWLNSFSSKNLNQKNPAVELAASC